MPAVSPTNYLVQAGWDDVPHLDAQTKKDLLGSMLPHLRDARTKGIPALGSGAIYPIPETEVVVKPFLIPGYWKRIFGFDVGWKRTAAIWLALDPDTDIAYGYTEYYRGQVEPPVHATAIRARGDWIPGAIDPASRGRDQISGRQLMVQYVNQGLHLIPAVNAVDAGLLEVFMRLSTGRLKFFETLMNTMAEYRLYRRDEKGNIVKDFDHLMDALRYAIMMLSHAKLKPQQITIGGGMGPADTRAGY